MAPATDQRAPRGNLRRLLRIVLMSACLAGCALELSASGPERTVMLGRGRSMWPTLPEVCRLVVVRVPFEEVKVDELAGDIISTRLNGVSVVHRAVARRPDGSVVTRGDNNPRRDLVPTTAANYVGVVIGFERPGSVGDLVSPVPRNR